MNTPKTPLFGWRSWLSAAVAAAGLSTSLFAAPVTVGNFSFEVPDKGTTGTTWQNAIGPEWTGTSGNNNASAFIEYSGVIASGNGGVNVVGNRQYLGMNLNYDVWQDLPNVTTPGSTFQASTTYTLTVGVGNRTGGSTNVGNKSVYSLVDAASGLVLDSGYRNAGAATPAYGTFAALPAVTGGTFSDGNPVTVWVPPSSALIGHQIRVLLQARGVGRSHFDNIRVDATAMNANLPGVITTAATSLGVTAATMNGTVTQVGSAAPTVTFYYGPVDGGSDPAAWTAAGGTSVAVSGTQSGAFSATVVTLAPGSTYYHRVRAVNGTGTTWSSPAQSFTTLPGTPLTVNNFSFEVPDMGTTGTTWINNIGPDWNGTGGQNTGNAFIEYSAATLRSDTPGVGSNRQYMGLVLGMDVWQDTPNVFAAGKTYVLRSGVGNRSGFSDATNLTTYGIATGTTGAVCDTAARNSGTVTVGTFSDGPSAVIYVPPSSPLVGQPIRVLLQARGTNRSHFDNIRLQMANMDTNLPGVITTAASSIAVSTATINGQVTQPGLTDPNVTFYFGTTDGGTDPSKWTSNFVVAGTQPGSFSQAVTGLSPATTYYYRVKATNSYGSTWSVPAQTFSTIATPPVVTNLAAKFVGPAVATLGGTVTDTGGVVPTLKVYYGTSDGGSTVAGWSNSVDLGPQGGSMSKMVGGLVPNTTYYFRAYAVHGFGEGWAAASGNFTTQSVALPAVDTLAAANVDLNNADLGANVTVIGNDAPSVKLFFGPADGGTTEGSWAGSVTLGLLAGKGSVNVGGLTAGTLYYCRAQATNLAGAVWAANTVTFTTDVVTAPSVATRNVTNITNTSATLQGEVTSSGDEAPTTTFYYGATDGGTNPANWTNSVTVGVGGGNFSRVLTGLTAGTTYYVRAFAQNSAGGTWAGSGETFTTAATAAPASVIINEINYDPVNPTYLTEYIELFNPTGSAVTLTGWRIASAVDYTFGAVTINAGDYLCVVGNTTKFDAAYANATLFPGASKRVGPWVGSLGNGGKTIELRNGAGQVVDSVDYKSGFPWPTAAKGAGPSAELVHPSLDNSLGASWRSSVLPGQTYAAVGSTWRWRRGVVGDTGETAAQFTSWRLASFVEPAVPAADAAWADAPLPMGYGDTDGVAGETENATLLPTMIAGGTTPDFTTVYLRKVFVPTTVPPMLALRVKVDDGAVVWVNGVEVARIRATAGHNAYSAVAAFQASEPSLQWSDTVFFTAASVNLVAGSNNVVAIHALNRAGNSDDFFIDAELKGVGLGGTPGAANGTLLGSLSAAPPAIRDVEHSPNEPAAGVPVKITATVTDPDGVGPVSLSYQTVDAGTYIRKADAAYSAPASWTSVPMVDDGTNGDAYAGDSVFTAVLPAPVQVNRRLVRYRITVADALANTVTVPYADDEQPNFAYFVYNGVPAWQGAFRPVAFTNTGSQTIVGGITPTQTYTATLLNTIRPWHVIANSTDVNLCQYSGEFNGQRWQGTVVYNGQVYDHVQFGVRGIGSTYNTGKNKWALFFNRARNIQVLDNWGRKFGQTWNSFGLDANAAPWAALNRGAAGVEEATSYRAFELAGVNALRTTYVHWRVIDGATEVAPPGGSVTDASFATAGDGQYSGDFWGLYLALEPTEANFLDERGLPQGNIYAIEGTGGDKKAQGPTQSLDASDWTTFRDLAQQGTSAATGQTEQWYRDNLDLKSLFTFVAVSRLIGNVDVRPGDNWRAYHRPTDNRWVTVPYDLDMQFIAGHHWGGAMDGVTVAGAPLTVRAMMRYPAIALEYRNRCREVLSLLGSDSAASGGQIGQLIDEYAQIVNPKGVALTWADADAALWNLHPKTSGSGTNTGQNNSRGNFYRALFLDGTRGGLGGTIQTGTWVRNLSDPDNDGFSDHEGLMEWYTNFSTNTYPSVPAVWTRKATSAGGGGTDSDPHRQKGYGFQYLLWETIYGGWFNSNTNPSGANADLVQPVTPAITYSGAASFPANDLRFSSSDFSDPDGAATVAAVQWRIGEISAPGIAGYDATQPRIYEMEELWTSAEIATASPTGIAQVRVPASSVRTGHTYRARVRHKDATGRWSFWSDPVQFTVSAPNVNVYLNSLVISEFNYNPAAPSGAAETGFTSDDFEFIELKNISALDVDLTDVRFTKGVDFDFPAGSTITAGGFKLVVRSLAGFQARYGHTWDSIIAGSYGPTATSTGDRLANGGEQIKLSYGTGTSIRDFVYDNVAPWPVQSDGLGRTDVLVDPASNPDHALPASWRASYVNGGSPGRDDLFDFAAFTALNSNAFDPLADDDNDGIANILEFAFGGNPLVANTLNGANSILPSGVFQNLTVSGTPADYITLSVTRPVNAAGLTYIPEFSPDLTAPSWVGGAVLVSSTTNGDGTVTEVWRSSFSVSDKERWFGHVRVVY